MRRLSERAVFSRFATTRRRVSVVAALAVVAQLLLTAPASASASASAKPTPHAWVPPDTPKAEAKVPTTRQRLHPAKRSAPATHPYRPAKVVLPAAGTVPVELSGVRTAIRSGTQHHRPDPDDLATPAATVRVAGSPLYLSSGGGDQRVAVTFAGTGTATAAGVHSGLAWTINGAAGARVKIGLDTTALDGISGGNFAQRLRLVQMPACALNTPQLSACQTMVPVTAATDAQTGRLTATVAVTPTASGATAWNKGTRPTAAASTAMTVLAAQSVPAGSAGTFTATSTKPSAQWSQGGATGGFTYSYPVETPPSLGGTAPIVTLDYSSQDVDGMTASGNSQASWLGSGWSYEPGYIERSYMPCSDDGISGSGDLCWGWGGAEVSLNQSGMGGQLVKDDGTGTAWHIADDNGAKVQLASGASNGAYQGEYWVITAQDGTRYYYGVNHLAGAEGGTGVDPATNSAWTVPVYCPKSSDPCYSSTTGTKSFATNMTYRWNLDYVVDPDGNAVVYTYKTEQNYYARSSTHTLTAYTRSGYLTTINYGWRTADVKTQATPAPAAQVVFTVGQRCTGTATECASLANLTSSTKADWPDTPFDLICASTGTCTNYSPAFFSSVQLQSIVTKVNKAGTLTAADTYTLAQSFPDPGDGTSPSLWLNKITHAGNVGGTVTLPAVVFTPTNMLPNRVPGLGTWPAYNHLRMYTIDDETGGHIEVTYTNTTKDVPKACDQTPGASVLPTASNDTMLCYQQYWTSPVGATNSDWFEKYVVAKVIVRDNVITGAPARETDYTYGGTPAWHRDDAVTTKNAQRSWNVFRGFGAVTTTTGTAPDPITQTTTTYLRGMDGDYQTSTGGTQRSITVSDSVGDTVTDANQYADMQLESDTYSAAGGTVQVKSVALPWSSQTAAHAESAQAGLPAKKAYFTKTATSIDAQLLASGGWRTVKTVNKYNATTGLLTQTDDQGDVSLLGTANSQETCSTTTYATPPTSGLNTGMLSYPSRSLRVAVTSSGPIGTGTCPAPTGTTSLTDGVVYYDGSTTPGVIPTTGTGNITRTDVADSYTGNTPTYVSTKAAATYDVYGRPTGNTDARGLVTSMAYTPATGQLPTSTTATDVTDNWSTTTTLDQIRQLPTKTVDPNGNTTQQTYDALGRLKSVWLPGMGKLQAASYVYTYGVNGSSAPSWTETQTLRDDGGTYDVAYQILNGFGEVRQTQAISRDDQNTSLITDSFYDSHGWASKTTSAYPASPYPSATLLAAPDSAVPAETLTGYDGRGRAVTSGFYSHANLQWQTTTAYPGADRTDVTPPTGGTATSTFIDALGRTSALWHYTTPTATGKTTDAAVIVYTYTPAGKPATVTGPGGGQAWSYGYDLHGNQNSAIDPDTGTSSSTYNVAGDLLTSTDANQQTITYTYDKLGRKTAEYAGTTSGTLLDSWTYDSAPFGKGQLASATGYLGGASGVAYTSTIAGYTNRGAVTGTSVTIPDSPQLPADQQPLKGTYGVTNTYNQYNGEPTSTAYTADGGLPAETVEYAYTGEGVLAFMGSSLVRYLNGVQADPYGRHTRWTLGAEPYEVTQTNLYDPATGALLQQFVDKETASTSVDNTVNLYNPAGQITASTDVEDGTATDRQCYTYNQLNQLTAAWTDNGTVTTAPTPSVSNIGGCITTTPTAANIGGPAPYWQNYHYNTAGNRDSETDHDPAGVAANDITRTYTYNTSTNPDRLQNETHTGPGAGTDNYGYDPTGQTKTRTIAGQATETFSYTPDHHTQTVSDTSGNTAGYVYDANGNLLIHTDTTAGATTTTLYLAGEQLTATAGTVHGTRYYGTAGGPTIIRTSDGKLTYQLANSQNTSSLTITADTAQTETRRHFTPYGTTRGTPAPTWIDNRQFLGQPADTTTGLDLLGARNYDPSTGRFLQPDPIFETTDPNQLGGYTYAGNNPVTNTDPTGLKFGNIGDGGPVDTGCNTPACADGFAGRHKPRNSDGGGGRRKLKLTSSSVVNIPADLEYLLKTPGWGWGDEPFTVGNLADFASKSNANWYVLCIHLSSDSFKCGNEANPYGPHRSTWQNLILVGTIALSFFGPELADLGIASLVADGTDELIVSGDAADDLLVSGNAADDTATSAADDTLEGGSCNTGPLCGVHGGDSGSPAGPGVVEGPAPAKALDMLNKVEGRAGGIGKVPGYEGNGTWGNKLGQLPGGAYREWDVNPTSDLPNCSVCGRTIRGPERLLTPKSGSGSVYYTPDHYGTFYYVGEM